MKKLLAIALLAFLGSAQAIEGRYVGDLTDVTVDGENHDISMFMSLALDFQADGAYVDMTLNGQNVRSPVLVRAAEGGKIELYSQEGALKSLFFREYDENTLRCTNCKEMSLPMWWTKQ